MSRSQRDKDALSSTLAKLRSEIEALQKDGKTPAVYSLGFTNGLIFCDHHINMRSGDPKFYNVTTSVGTLPKPQALKSADDIAAEQEYEFLTDKIITAAREATQSYFNTTEEWEPKLVDLETTIKERDAFMLEQVRMQEAGRVEGEAASDANSGSQDGSSPSPAAVDFTSPEPSDAIPAPV